MPHLADPQELAAGQEESAVRRLDCQSYRACLNFAAKARWASWSCASCKAFTAFPRGEPALRRGCPLSFEE